MNGDLPQGWASIALGDLLNFKYGKGLPQEKRNGKGLIKVFGSNGVVGLHDSAVTKGPTIIIGRKGSVGEVHLSPEGCWPIDTTYFIDEFPANLPPPYWTLYLKSLRLGQQEKSSAIPGISRDDVYALEVPVPPLAEQQRIVAKLELLLGQVEACQQRLDKIPTLLKRFRQSVLAAACSGRLTKDWREENPSPDVGDTNAKDQELPQSWRLISADQVCTKITDGEHLIPKQLASGKSFLSAKNVRDGFIDFSTQVYISTEDFNKSVKRCNPEQGDVLLVCVGATIGRAAIVSETTLFALSRSVALLKPKMVSGKLLLFTIQSRFVQEQIQEFTSGTAQPHLFLNKIIKLHFPIPPLPEQQEIVRRVESLFALADNIEQRYKKAQAFIDKLTPSLLAKAFRGELVPQDPNDEPAAVLLGRIRGEKPDKPKKRGKD